MVTSADVSLSTPPTGSGTYSALVGRHVSSNDYRANVQWPAAGPVTLAVTKVVGGAETTLASRVISSLLPAGSDAVPVRFQLAGSGVTMLNAKVWKTGTPEPAAWPASTTDTIAALQGPGGISRWAAANATNIPATASFDNLVATG